MNDNIIKSAHRLQEVLEGFNSTWTIGVTNDLIYVYIREVNHSKHPRIQSLELEGWHGYRVICQYVGKFCAK